MAKLRIVLVEDDAFSRNLLTQLLTDLGHEVTSVGTATEAVAILNEQDANILVADLDLGSGPTGIDLARLIASSHPYMGFVFLTSHASPELVGHRAADLPAGSVYLVKGQVKTADDLAEALDAALSGTATMTKPTVGEDGRIAISAAQAEVLGMLAQGLSNQAIADERGTSLRAVENLITRTFQAMGLGADKARNSRVEAVRMWISGQVVVK